MLCYVILSSYRILYYVILYCIVPYHFTLYQFRLKDMCGTTLKAFVLYEWNPSQDLWDWQSERDKWGQH